MAWIESHETLKEHPKLHQMCETLSISRPTAIGHLHLLWWWCINYALDGKLHYTNVQIARAAMWEGDADKFIDALVAAGFIDRGNDALSIHDWSDFCGSLIDKRLERQEKAKRGSRTAAKRRTTAAKREKVGAVRHLTNPTNPTIPNQPNQPNQPPPTPSVDEDAVAIRDGLSCFPGFDEAWAKWEQYRRELKKKLTDTSRKEQLSFLARQPDPVACIEQSIRNQWQGLFELKGNFNGGPGTNQQGRNSGGGRKSGILPGDVSEVAAAARRIGAVRSGG